MLYTPAHTSNLTPKEKTLVHCGSTDQTLSQPPPAAGLADLFPSRQLRPRPPRTIRHLHFFDLPLSVRQHLYTFLYTRPVPLDLRSLRPPALALVNRRLFDEVTEAVFRGNCVGVGVPVLYDRVVDRGDEMGEWQGWREAQGALRGELAFNAEMFYTGSRNWMALVGEGKGVRLRRVVFWLGFPASFENGGMEYYSGGKGRGRGRGRAEVTIEWDSRTGGAIVRSSLQGDPDTTDNEEEEDEQRLLSPRRQSYTSLTLPPPATRPVQATLNPYSLSPFLASTPSSSTSTPSAPARTSLHDRVVALSPLETAATAQGFETLCVTVGALVARRAFDGFTIEDLDVMAGSFEVGGWGG